MEPGGYRIFIVEDSPLLAGMLRERFVSVGLTVVGQSDNAKDALERIEMMRPDAVTIDLALRGDSGIDVLRGLQKSNSGYSPVKIVLTNYTNRPYRLAAQRLGARYFFDKAQDINALIQTLTALARDANRRNGSEP